MITAVEVRTADQRHATDRWDGCGAPAQVLVILTNVGDPVFCEHHARQYRTSLKPITVVFEHLPGSR